MSEYPVILIPRRIEEVKSALPPVQEFSVAKPQQPGLEPKKIDYNLLVLEVAGAVIGVPIFSSLTHSPAVFWFFIAVVAIAYHLWYQVNSYPQRKQEHNKLTADYSVLLQTWAGEKYEHDKKEKAKRTPEKIAEFQYKLLLETLSKTVGYDDDGSHAPKGRTERKFEEFLNNCFPGKIQTDLKVQNPEYSEGYHYTPDFAYIHPNLNLYIDIEIDEPYTGNKPTHYIELKTQQVRDEHFNGRGWIVIRFSEEQVVSSPHSCCKVVASVISQITGDNTKLTQFVNVPDLKPTKRWTQQEAMQMMENQSREQYRF